MTYATISTIFMFFCFLHFVIPPVKTDSAMYLKIMRMLLAFAPIALTVTGMLFAPTIIARVLFGVVFGGMMTYVFIRMADRAAEKEITEKAHTFQAKADAYNRAHQDCDEILHQRAMHLQHYEAEQEEDLELLARLELETRAAYDRLSQAVQGLQDSTVEFPSGSTAADRAVGQLTMFKKAIANLRDVEAQYGWHTDGIVPPVSEDDVDKFRDFLNQVNPNDFVDGKSAGSAKTDTNPEASPEQD